MNKLGVILLSTAVFLGVGSAYGISINEQSEGSYFLENRNNTNGGFLGMPTQSAIPPRSQIFIEEYMSNTPRTPAASTVGSRNPFNIQRVIVQGDNHSDDPRSIAIHGHTHQIEDREYALVRFPIFGPNVRFDLNTKTFVKPVVASPSFLSENPEGVIGVTSTGRPFADYMPAFDFNGNPTSNGIQMGREEALMAHVAGALYIENIIRDVIAEGDPKDVAATCKKLSVSGSKECLAYDTSVSSGCAKGFVKKCTTPAPNNINFAASALMAIFFNEGVEESTDPTCSCVPAPLIEISPLCGNGTVNGTEQCDDGGNVGGDGCSAQCTTEKKGVCGDGILDQTIQQGVCSGKACGDGVTGEQCDMGSQNGLPASTCDKNCKRKVACIARSGSTNSCGDCIVTAPETCDNGNQNGTNNNACGNNCEASIVCKDRNVTATVPHFSGQDCNRSDPNFITAAFSACRIACSSGIGIGNDTCRLFTPNFSSFKCDSRTISCACC